MKLFESLVPATTPGAFKARCNLTEHRWERRLTEEERAEAKANGYERVFIQLDHERVDPETRRHGRWEVCFPACSGFETTDPEAYLRHMAEAHNRPLSWAQGYAESFVRSVRSGWRSPALKAQGKPLVKEAAALTRSCASCGLVAEVWGNAGELWWSEHERGCHLVVAS